jgi:hypothetical protein
VLARVIIFKPATETCRSLALWLQGSHAEKSMATDKLQSNLQDEYNSTFDKLYKIWFDADTRNSDAWKNDIWRKANTMSAVLGYCGAVKDTDSERANKAIEILTDG